VAGAWVTDRAQTSTIPKSGNRFSDKIVLKQACRAGVEPRCRVARRLAGAPGENAALSGIFIAIDTRGVTSQVKHRPSMIPKSGHRFSERSCSNTELERDDDSKKVIPL
jgi:hypothetical protein